MFIDLKMLMLLPLKIIGMEFSVKLLVFYFQESFVKSRQEIDGKSTAFVKTIHWLFNDDNPSGKLYKYSKVILLFLI